EPSVTRKGLGGRAPVWGDEVGRTALRLLRLGYKDLGLDAKFQGVVEQIRPRLPGSIRKSDAGTTFYNGCRKALESLPPDYEWCVSRIWVWGGQRWDEDPAGPYKYMDGLITIAGANVHRLVERFDRWDQQYGDAGTKFGRLEKFRARITLDPMDWGLRPKPA